MAFEPGGMSEKLGNRYEGRWVAKQLLRLLNEDIQSVTVELIGPDERGVDLLIVEKDGTHQLQQCKARCASRESWTISALRDKGILEHLSFHLGRDPNHEFALVSAIPARTFADISESARNSNDHPWDFFQYQVEALGEQRRKVFQAFCDAVGLDPQKDDDLERAFDYLKRTHIELFPDDRNTWSDLVTWTGFILTGKPESAISVLLTYAENNDTYRKPVYADELRRYLAEKHGIHPRQLEHDRRIAPAIEELQKQFFDSIRPGLINKEIIPREETSRIIEAMDNGRDVVVHGAAGNGKSGGLYELAEHLRKKSIPYLPIRLDRRVPKNTASLFGQDLGLPESPAHCLFGLAADRKAVLILDQLDAIRWTAAHSSSAMDVCRELLRQVRSLRRTGRQIVIVFACRTFDLENDPEIKKLFADSSEQGVVKVPVGEFSDEQLTEVIGPDGFAVLNGSQKRVLSCPQNLAIWLELKNEGRAPTFRSATELMRRFWENRRRLLEEQAGISAEQMDAFLIPLLDYMESRGEISAPVTMASKDPAVRDAFISFGILLQGAGRISFCHQRYLDHLIAERLLQKIYQGTGSVIEWLGPRQNQSLFRREQLRQVLAMLAEESPADFFDTARTLLESKDVRFHLKHLVLELIGQMGRITSGLGSYFLGLLDDPNWRDHVLETVLLGHHPWASYLLEAGGISKWLESEDEQEINRALWLLRSVAEHIPDSVTEILAPFVDRGNKWPARVLNTICWNEADDSEKMFELRLQPARLGVVKDFVDWKSLCARYPLRAVQLIEAVLSTWNMDGKEASGGRKGRLERWYDQDLEALNNAVKKYPAWTWDLLMPHVERLTNIQADHYDPRLQKWMDERFSRNETDMARGVVELLILAGQILAAEQPDELTARAAPLEKSISSVVQEIIIAAYAHLHASRADIGISWLLDDPARFRLGSGYHEPEWMPAVRLIKALSSHSSEELFRRLEDAIVHYHAPEEKRDAKHYLKGWRDGYFGHYWGKTQYFLLPALDATRIRPTTAALIRVLERKFANYSKKRFLKGGTTSGGWVGSKLDPNLEKISDRAWLKIVTSKKVTESDHGKWIQVDPDHVITTSIRQFASSLGRMAKRYPERFGRLALRFSDDVHPAYVSAILDGFGAKKPGKEVSEPEIASWQPASVETIEAVLEKYQAGDDRETAMSFCRLVVERADENWSDKTIARLVYYARSHPDLEPGKLNLHCDKNSYEATVEVLLQNTINCVRGVAAGAIGRLLWERNDRLEQVRPGIESLVHDPHPAVRMAAIEAIEPVFNIDKDLTVSWFCEACRADLRVAASPRAAHFFNYTVPGHIDQVGPIIQQMAMSFLDEVVFEGARQVTARWLFHGFFEKEFAACCQGTVPQRKGVANVAAALLQDKKYSRQCQKLLRKFMNDPENEVRDELRGMFRNKDFITDVEYAAFVKDYINSQAFADDPDHFVWSLKDLAGSLILVADAIFAVCEALSMTLQEKNRDIGSRYPHMASEMSSILLRLYEQAQGERNSQIADRCLDIWDLLFENRVGRTMELTRAIEQ
jgi:hypothetical protein